MQNQSMGQDTWNAIDFSSEVSHLSLGLYVFMTSRLVYQTYVSTRYSYHP